MDIKGSNSVFLDSVMLEYHSNQTKPGYSDNRSLPSSYPPTIIFNTTNHLYVAEIRIYSCPKKEVIEKGSMTFHKIVA